MGMPAKDIPKDYILERLEAILNIFAKIDGGFADTGEEKSIKTS